MRLTLALPRLPLKTPSEALATRDFGRRAEESWSVRRGIRHFVDGVAGGDDCLAFRKASFR